MHNCSAGYCFNRSKVVDGMYVPATGEQELQSLAHTELGNTSWIQIDLKTSFRISAVKIWSRAGDNGGSFIAGYWKCF